MAYIEEIVHIIPLGYEIDRAIKPFEKFKANRVHLLVIPESDQYPPDMVRKQIHFLDIVRKALEEKGIEVHVRDVDLFNMLEVMKNVSGIILEEISHNNIVYVNMSSCGRLTSVGTTLAAMTHNARIYYVVADRYSKTEKEELTHGLSVCEKLSVVFLENFRLRLPDEASLKILVKLCREERGSKTVDVMDFLRESGVQDFEEDYKDLEVKKERRRVQISHLMKLNKKYLEKLERSGYILREKVGRYNTIKITESGKYVAHISGLLEQSSPIHR